MANQLIIDRLCSLESQLKTLLELYNNQKDELLQNRKEIEKLRKLVEDRDQEIKNFQNQHKITKIVSSIADDNTDNVELKLKINEFIREIDKCIAHLSE